MDEYTKATAREMDDAEWLKRASKAAHMRASDRMQAGPVCDAWLMLALALDAVRATKIRVRQASGHLQQMGLDIQAGCETCNGSGVIITNGVIRPADEYDPHFMRVKCPACDHLPTEEEVGDGP